MNSTFDWIYYDSTMNRIDILNFERNSIGNYTISINFNNRWTKKLTTKQLFVVLKNNRPPTVVDKILKTDAFKGQSLIKIYIDDIFIDYDDNFTISPTPWFSKNVNVTKSIQYSYENKSIFAILNPDFVGNWSIDLIATDSIFQTAQTFALINGNIWFESDWYVKQNHKFKFSYRMPTN